MFSLDVSHSEFNLNIINTDEAIFMDMILAPEVAPEMTHKSEDERSKQDQTYWRGLTKAKL